MVLSLGFSCELFISKHIYLFFKIFELMTTYDVISTTNNETTSSLHFHRSNPIKAVPQTLGTGSANNIKAIR